MTESKWLGSEDPHKMFAWLLDAVPPGSAGGFAGPMRAVVATDRKLRLFCVACLAHSDQALIRDGARGRFDYGENGEKIGEQTLIRVCRDWADTQNDYDPSKSVKADLFREIFGNPHAATPFQILVATTPNYGAPEKWESWCTRQILALSQAAYDERLDHTAAIKGLEKDIETQSFIMSRCTSDGAYRVYQQHLDDFHSALAALRKQPRGTLDSARLAVLSDALEESGCDNEDMLHHLRGFARCPRCLAHTDPRTGEYVLGWHCKHCEGKRFLPSPASHVRGCWVLDLLLGES